MKIIVTGAGGQLGHDLVRILGKWHEVVGFDRKSMDVCDLDQCKEIIYSSKPDIVIHAAAFTAVDQAEVDRDKAYLVNAYGSRNVAICAQEIGAKICYVSTDYVFDGNSKNPYTEYDNTNPIGIYGKSKRAGELLVQNLSNRFFIVRTSWLYGLYGNNFVKTMIKVAQEKKSLKVVNDQVGSPTYTVDLTYFLASLINTDYYGIYHASNTGTCTWYEFAKTIFEEYGIDVNLEPCSTEEFPRPAPRPKYSVLEHMSIRANGFEDLRHWRDALKAFLNELRNSTRHRL